MRLRTKVMLIGLAGVLIGALLVLGFRFATYHKKTVHYHANFAVYINGKREAFNVPIYYTETACSVDTTMTPKERAHMHDNVNDVVHVEDHAVTWSQFFENLGWYVGPDFIAKPDGTMYATRGGAKLNILLNGQYYTGSGALSTAVIQDKDKLLVSYGHEDQQALDAQFKTIASTAAKYDATQDPASCSGSRKTTFKDRLDHLF